MDVLQDLKCTIIEETVFDREAGKRSVLESSEPPIIGPNPEGASGIFE